jgi:hypothetical protein
MSENWKETLEQLEKERDVSKELDDALYALYSARCGRAEALREVASWKASLEKAQIMLPRKEEEYAVAREKELKAMARIIELLGAKR